MTLKMNPKEFSLEMAQLLYQQWIFVTCKIIPTNTTDERTVKISCSTSVLVLRIFFFCVLFCRIKMFYELSSLFHREPSTFTQIWREHENRPFWDRLARTRTWISYIICMQCSGSVLVLVWKKFSCSVLFCVLGPKLFLCSVLFYVLQNRTEHYCSRTCVLCSFIPGCTFIFISI